MVDQRSLIVEFLRNLCYTNQNFEKVNVKL